LKDLFQVSDVQSPDRAWRNRDVNPTLLCNKITENRAYLLQFQL